MNLTLKHPDTGDERIVNLDALRAAVLVDFKGHFGLSLLKVVDSFSEAELNIEEFVSPGAFLCWWSAGKPDDLLPWFEAALDLGHIMPILQYLQKKMGPGD